MKLTFVHKCIMIVDKTSQRRRDTSGVIAKPSDVCADEKGIGALPTGFLERFRGQANGIQNAHPNCIHPEDSEPLGQGLTYWQD